MLALVGAALLAPVVAGQDQTPTPTPTSTTATSTPTDPPSPTQTPGQGNESAAATPVRSSGTPDGDTWTLDELRRGGEHPASAPPSVRYLPNRQGAVSIRYTPSAPLQNDLQFMQPGSTLHTDDLQLYSTRFGVQGDQPVTLRAVFYSVGQETGPNGSTREVATDVKTRTFTMNLGYGYDTNNFTLPSHYEDPRNVHLRLEVGGEPVSGARWTFSHQTVQSEQAPAMTIDSRGDLWVWAGKNIFLVVVPGLLISATGIKGIVRKTGRGPDKSLSWWAIAVIAPALLIVATVGYFRTAQVAARLPQVFGAIVVLIGAIAMLETMGRTRRTDEFVRDEIEDAQAPLGEALQNVVYKDKRRVYTVERDEGLGLIKTGIRPFLARLFAKPAVLDTSSLKTQVKFEQGPDDRQFITHPEADEPLVWKPAHWAFEWSMFRDGEGSAFERFKWVRLGATAFSAGIGWVVGLFLFDTTVLPTLLAGALGFVVLAAKARDGYCEFEPAPTHYREARATIAALQEAHKDAMTVEELYEENWSIRATTAKDIKELSEERDRTVTEQLAAEETGIEVFDMGLENGNGRDPNPDAGGDSERARAASDDGSAGSLRPDLDLDSDGLPIGGDDGGEDDE